MFGVNIHFELKSRKKPRNYWNYIVSHKPKSPTKTKKPFYARYSRPEVFHKKAALRNFAKLTKFLRTPF